MKIQSSTVFLVGVLFVIGALKAASLKVVNETEFKRIFPATATVTELANDLRFAEGPVWIGGDQGFLVFSDIPANKLMQWVPGKGLSVFREVSNNANGNTLDLQGRLLTAEHGARRVSLTRSDGSTMALLTEFEGKRLNSPNDVVVRSDGTLWFTDPDYGLRNRPKEQEGNFVYRYDPLTRELKAVIRDFDKPNGLCFSPDESLLYVADSGRPKHIRVFDVTAESVTNGRVFVKLDKGGPDGIRCDADGRIWSSSGDGAQVFMPAGILIARIVLPKGGANLAFGGPQGRTLFITARNFLFSVETLVRDARPWSH
ncbi:MAG: Gluconolactonase [Verrucomicrobia subdivision 3 bacterium]|nr:Gluconolactonase [Limisphaerales bacterium]MCS1417591.1 Gluconolactonase [Limisphaerales bacterium]